MWRLRITTLIVILTGLSAQAAHAQGVRWRTDLEAAKREAAQSGRLVLLHFWATWCKPCMKLERTVFNQPHVAAGLEQRYVPVKVDVDSSPSIAKEYQIGPIPADVVITPSGQKVGKTKVGFRPANRYVAELARGAVDAGRQPGSNSQQAPGFILGSVQPRQDPRHQGERNWNFPRREQEAVEWRGRQSPNSPRYGKPFSGDPRQATQDSRNNSGRNGSGTPAVVDPARQSAQPKRPAPVEKAPPQAQTTGLPPLGFDGYCLISMHQHQVWIKGDPKWGAIHEGRLYFFANQSARDLFLSDGPRFAPVLSNFDAVLFFENGQRVNGQRAYGATYQAPNENGPRIYLFANEATLQHFEQNPVPYVERLHQLQRRYISQQRLRGKVR